MFKTIILFFHIYNCKLFIPNKLIIYIAFNSYTINAKFYGDASYFTKLNIILILIKLKFIYIGLKIKCKTIELMKTYNIEYKAFKLKNYIY